MTRSPSAEPAKSCSSSKRKGTRSVSTLTPSQLARKRANDREAQRAIRARTKEHIERLEHELEELRSNHGRDKTVQDLIRRNKALEEELRQLKESMGVPIISSPYSAPTGTASTALTSHTADGLEACVASSHQPPQLLTPCLSAYDDSCGAVPSPRMSPLPAGRADYISDYSQTTQQYMPMPTCEAWASNLPSSVPSPSSSVNTDEYGPASGYIPTSVPNNMIGGGMGLIDGSKNAKVKYEDVHSMMANQGYMQQSAHHQHHSSHQQQHQQQHPQQHHQPQQPQQRPQNWSMYQGMYYDNGQNTACVTR
ncbi:hypothetical protein E4U17_005911 [Claviceps sp. LM77 group G4]|nr:hypothetical protein E4U17_005911 [Claviceps sp. LM77 group G4]KAG6061038.1 hypothetical protein E4U33_006770 [Claviceps sp. LM78 group G4]KAG6072374.1 hypothetical protein E4U16_005385 [Claviceps sp. LM84 group G4]